jgi:hypothetical protein
LAYLPSKKFILISAACLLAIGGGFLVFQSEKRQKSAKIPSGYFGAKQIMATEIDKDSDNDGLKDWEEALWKTDPNNPDTDGDNTPDGQEIKENRNPLLAGKNDKLENPKLEKTETSVNEPSSLTDVFSQQFFSNYLSLKEQGGGQISEQDKQELVTSFLEATNSLGQSPKEFYVKSDLKINSEETKESVKEYGNNLAIIIKKHFDPIPETEMTILQKSLGNGNEAGLKNLEQIATAYRDSAKEIILLKTPVSFADSHLNLANYFYNISQEINAMQKTFEDPMQALLAFKQYQEDSSSAYQILRDINDYFLNKKVVFENNEPAKLFKVYLE